MPVPIGDFTPAALLGLAIVAILWGWLVPRRTVQDIKEDRDQWRTAHSTSEKAREAQSSQLKELLELARATDKVIRSLPQAPTKEPSK